MSPPMDDATRAQVAAAAPEVSTWLSANAGSGNVAIGDDSAATAFVVVTGDATIQAHFDVRSTAISRRGRVPTSLSLNATDNGVLVGIPEHLQGPVVLRLFGVDGHLVRTYVARSAPGRFAMDFASGERPPGTGYYLCSMRAGRFHKTVRVLVGR